MKVFLKFALLICIATLSNIAWATKNILVFGDSLSAGYGISRNASWVSLVQAELRKKHPQYEVINASLSGETSAGGLRRIDQALLQHHPVIVILELGANDGLRGSTLTETEKNLSAIILKAKQTKAKVLLLGMQLPPNYGLNYTAQFQALFPKLAKTHRIALLPYFLNGVAADQFQADNLHPNAAAQSRMMQNVLTSLQPLLRE
jgi:acyl-CoA thioesterase-1